MLGLDVLPDGGADEAGKCRGQSGTAQPLSTHLSSRPDWWVGKGRVGMPDQFLLIEALAEAATQCSILPHALKEFEPLVGEQFVVHKGLRRDV